MMFGLGFVLAAELHEVRTEPELRALRDDASPRAADNRSQHLPGNRPNLKLLSFGRLRGSMAQEHVGQLMAHHAGDLALGFPPLRSSAVRNIAHGQSEGIDLFLVESRRTNT
jgi:hypothetical protein